MAAQALYLGLVVCLIVICKCLDAGKQLANPRFFGQAASRQHGLVAQCYLAELNASLRQFSMHCLLPVPLLLALLPATGGEKHKEQADSDTADQQRYLTCFELFWVSHENIRESIGLTIALSASGCQPGGIALTVLQDKFRGCC